MSETCSNCGHPFDRISRCSECNRELACGSVTEPCPRDGCQERVIALKYQSQEDCDEAAALGIGVSTDPRRD